MAVADKKKITKEQLILETGDIVNVELIRAGYNVGLQEMFADAVQVAPYRVKRAEKAIARLKAAIDEAIELDLPDDEYGRREKALTDYKKSQEAFLETVNLGILTMIAQWDEALDKENEDAGIYVPLTQEGLATLHPLLRLDIFLKTMDKLSTRSNEEKKDSSASYKNDTPIPKESKVPYLTSGHDTKSPCDTGNGQSASSDGILMSSTKPS